MGTTGGPYLSPVNGISHTCVNGSGDDARIG